MNTHESKTTRGLVDMGHTSLAMTAARASGKLYEELVLLPDSQLYELIPEVEPKDLMIEYVDGSVFNSAGINYRFPDGAMVPHRRNAPANRKLP